jgi:hypothetical protein
MTMYKVLYLDDDRQKVLSGFVCADDGERWESLVQALNDLASIGFEVQTPIYGPAPQRTGSGPVIEAFLLLSRSATVTSDGARRVNRTKALLAAAEEHLATLSGDTERTLQEMRVRELRAEVDQIEQRLRRTASGVEATDQPNEAAARMTDLAQQAARHFEENDFEEALSVLKELERLRTVGAPEASSGAPGSTSHELGSANGFFRNSGLLSRSDGSNDNSRTTLAADPARATRSAAAGASRLR